jgi:hypothetical protein
MEILLLEPEGTKWTSKREPILLFQYSLDLDPSLLLVFCLSHVILFSYIMNIVTLRYLKLPSKYRSLRKHPLDCNVIIKKTCHIGKSR